MNSPNHRLSLRVTQLNGRPASGIEKVFGERGGTIGRAAQNDWVLADPSCQVSAHHATVYFEHGRFHLVDCSRNGVFLNGTDEPLGIERIATLNDGDRLQLGSYEIVVNQPALNEAPAAATRSDPTMAAGVGVAATLPEDSWSDLIAARPAAADGATRTEALDPLALFRANEAPARLAPATQRDDAPILATPFVPPAAARNTLPEDWLHPQPRHQHDRAARAAHLIGTATAALREAAAALEALRATLHDVPAAAARQQEKRHGMA